MAFKDENGRITIDESAAYNDIYNLRKSIESLTEALNMITAVEARTSDFKGKTAESLNGATSSIAKKIKAMINNTEETINFISSTVYKYQKIDEDIKNQINNTNL